MSGQKYHVTDDGRVMRCSATLKECKYSSRNDDRHYEDIADAKAKANDMLVAKYGSFSKYSRNQPGKRVNRGKVFSRSMELNSNLISNQNYLDMKNSASFDDFHNLVSSGEKVDSSYILEYQ